MELNRKGGHHDQAPPLPEESVLLPGHADDLALTGFTRPGIRLPGVPSSKTPP